MNILIDSSVWIDAYSSRPTIDLDQLRNLLDQGQVSTIYPIPNEVLSGQLHSKARLVLVRGFEAMERIDPDWNSSETWTELLSLAHQAHSHGISPLGVVDRMILLSAKTAGCPLWTLDKKAQRLAKNLRIPTL